MTHLFSSNTKKYKMLDYSVELFFKTVQFLNDNTTICGGALVITNSIC